MPITNRDRYPNEVFFDESDFLEIGTRADGAKIIQVGKEGDAPIVAFAYTSEPTREELYATELWSLMKFSQDTNEFSFHSNPIKLSQNIRVIYKYEIPKQGQFSLDLAVDTEILTVQVQNQSLCLWALLNQSSPKRRRDFVWIRTGEEIEHKSMSYIATIQVDAGKKVVHLFELRLDYSQLENLLVKEQWREADLETFKILGKLCGVDNSPDGELISQSGVNIAALSDLQAIDKLWSKYSNGHFGYSTQLSITRKMRHFWENVERNQSGWRDLCKQLGWNTGFSALNFSLEAPKGHLPAIVGWGMGFGPCGSEEIYRSLWSKFNSQK
jgi:hypothetical protein